MDVTLVLADAAQEAGGKLFVLGGGWTHAASADRPMSMALGLIIGVPWDRTNEQHAIRAALVTDDGEAVSVGGTTVEMATALEIGRPPGLKRGTTLNAVMTMQFNGIVLTAGGYVWEVGVNGDPEARAPFWIVPAPPGA